MAQRSWLEISEKKTPCHLYLVKDLTPLDSISASVGKHKAVNPEMQNRLGFKHNQAI
jgi:hypothetical protein